MRVPLPSGVSCTLALPLAKPAAPPCPSNVMVYDVGGTMSDSTMRPLNFADTGPTRAVIATEYSLSATRSIDSQPAMHALSTCGSLSARQVASTLAGTTRLLLISMAVPFEGGSRGSGQQLRPTPAAHVRAARKRARQLLQAFQIMHRKEFIDIRQHGADARRTRLEAFIAQQRIEPDQATAGLGKPLH